MNSIESEYFRVGSKVRSQCHDLLGQVLKYDPGDGSIDPSNESGAPIAVVEWLLDDGRTKVRRVYCGNRDYDPTWADFSLLVPEDYGRWN